ncbi:DUF4239 domain-containing protein [Chitinophaga oryziterrae]|uniref:DUF4239 domain-containing protein n=1 Tax=Chitinophaga oryziterrae TaxID=1031224 RepID=A0A6N8JBI3_9BACT|nr:DUF4239 domain-containing protein [Chitinophaga oryziterrae]MVT41676.1 DUF4239 domain-containing protein [Chitinophaga oryziterrae]
MSFSYALLSVPPVLLMLLMLLVFAFTGGLSTWLFRKFIRVRVLRSHNEVTGNIFACAGGLYSLLLAFVVFLVWDGFNDAGSHADMEFSVAKGLYRDIQFYPDTAESGRIKRVYLEYINKVITEEYPAMGRLEPMPLSSKKAFDNVFIAIEQMQPQNINLNARSDEMFRHLNELATNRSLRQLSANTGIPFELWLPILIGGLITLIFVTMLDIENMRLHIFLSAMLGAFIGLVIYLIVILDYPFSGYLSIQPTGYREILQWEKAL